MTSIARCVNSTKAEAELVASPCISVCQMRLSDGLCAGCARTLEEIAHWGGMSNPQRHQVLERVRLRWAALPAPMHPRRP